MVKSSNIRDEGILSYVINGTTIFNTVILILHICFGVFFYMSNADILYYYNFLSILTYIVGYVLLYQGRSNVYIFVVNIEVYIFMLLTVIGLGWGYGFQQYCIVFIVSFLFSDYCVSQEFKLNKITVAAIVISVCSYFGLRIWSYFHPYIYYLNNTTLECIFYVANSAIAFAFLIAYSYMYSQTVFRLEHSLVDMATRDTLTGLYNRRKMHDLLNAMSELLTSASNQMCIAMIDVDNFKKVNDSYGHYAGDEVLKMVAEILLAKSKEHDSFYSCRWGGEEFLVFYRMQSRSEEEIIHEFDDLRQKIADTTVVYNEQEIGFTVTIGLSFYKEDLTVAKMIKIADDNLYEGKKNGKNTVVYEKA